MSRMRRLVRKAVLSTVVGASLVAAGVSVGGYGPFGMAHGRATVAVVGAETVADDFHW
jgi:hypothetical protein